MKRKHNRRGCDFRMTWLMTAMVITFWLLYPQTVLAYIGPGVGFALMGSATYLIVTAVLVFVLLLFWPVRVLWKLLRRKSRRGLPNHRVVVLGLDGLDHALTGQYIRAGILPNLKKLAASGTFTPLRTTCPPISPVAWSTFQTGVNPGRHHIYDFLRPDRQSYQPKLSSCEIGTLPGRSFAGGLFACKNKTILRLLRKSKPFWEVLGEEGIFSHILRVPITFPPQKFYGNLLAAMCTPDLKGTQGTFTVYRSDGGAQASPDGGHNVWVQVDGSRVKSRIEGPLDTACKRAKHPLSVPFEVDLDGSGSSATLYIAGQKIPLAVAQYTDWIRVSFKTRRGRSVKGLCRFYLKQIAPVFELYLSPVNIDPEYPAMPVSVPGYYGKYLSKLNGPFGTLGLLEDTWALNQGALDEAAFLKQAYLAHDEREKMFFDALDKTDRGVCACVFDASDRIQHTFWRYLEEDHPAPKPRPEEYRHAIPEMYRKMDRLVGRVVARLKPRDTLMVISDHGFNSFRRCVNLNTWLWQNGFLSLKGNQITGKDLFGDVDWARTRAYAMGMGAIFLNLKGREVCGIVAPSDALAVKGKICQGLKALQDPQTGDKPVLRIYDADTIYNGPYQDDAPDLTVGWQAGYRASWESATGKLGADLFEDNTKAWSGDHCVDREIVPGVFFSNKVLKDKAPAIIDMAPTILDQFNVEVPGYMEGRALDLAP